MIRRKERYALRVDPNSDPRHVAQGIVTRWVGQDYSPYHRGFRMARIPEPPATLRLALADFCKSGGVLLVDTFNLRPSIVAWTKESGVPEPPRIDHIPRLENASGTPSRQGVVDSEPSADVS